MYALLDNRHAVVNLYNYYILQRSTTNNIDEFMQLQAMDIRAIKTCKI